jgi:glycosyltransferase involved in cell wall biosynthesis
MTPTVSRVVIINDFSIARGGATALVLLLLRFLRAQGIAVTIIVGDNEDNSDFGALGVDVVRLGQETLLGGNPLKSAISGIHNGVASALIADWINRNDTPQTIYHMHIWSQIFSPAVFVPLRKVAARTIIHAHDSFHACPNGAFMDYQKGEACSRIPLGLDCIRTHCDRRSYPQKLWRVARQARLSLAMGSTVPWGKIAVLHEKMIAGFERAGYHARDLRVVKNPVQPFIARRIAAEHNKSFFFIGRLEQDKGPQDALEAARAAGVPLEVIGDGPMRTELEAQYPDMTFHGWRVQEEIGALTRNARCLVIPSRYPEPFGLVAVEAASSGLPLLLTEMALLADEITELGMGIACNTRNITAFAAALRTMADMPTEELKEMSEKAFSQAHRLANSPAEWGAELVRLYEEVLGDTQTTSNEMRISERKALR